MSVPQKTFEPQKIAAGDTINFVRAFSNYPASKGWSLKYEMRGGAQAIEFTSTAQGDSHAVTVASSVTALWLPKLYVLDGYAENSGTGERQRVYSNAIEIAPNLEAAAPDLDVRTHAQKMLELIEAVQIGKAAHDIIESDVEQTRIKRLSPAELRDEYNFWLFRRQQEIQAKNASNGRATGRNRLVQFVDPSGGGVNQFGALPPIFPNTQGQS
jgi:hypothetical protein